MRLINTKTKLFEEFTDVANTPPYAILSHTWEVEEVTFKDYRKGRNTHFAGYKKIRSAINQAQQDDLNYLWIDTCCINKESSAELSLAINSMYSWYERAHVCYAYLQDFSPEGDPVTELRGLRWFQRGWTLQELVAPRVVVFYNSDWSRLFTKLEQAQAISQITRIPTTVLQEPFKHHLQACPIAVRMSWAATRETTRQEDQAYCLMGIFDVNMPLLYGEGGRAFIRLQEEIMKISNDLSLFAWGFPRDRSFYADPSDHTLSGGMLATSPYYFRDSYTYSSNALRANKLGQQHSMTHTGLCMTLPVKFLKSGVKEDGYQKALLQLACTFQDNTPLTLTIRKRPKDETWERERLKFGDDSGKPGKIETLFFRSHERVMHHKLAEGLVNEPIRYVGCFPSFAATAKIEDGICRLRCSRPVPFAVAEYAFILSFRCYDRKFLVIAHKADESTFDIDWTLAQDDDSPLSHVWENTVRTSGEQLKKRVDHLTLTSNEGRVMITLKIFQALYSFSGCQNMALEAVKQ